MDRHEKIKIVKTLHALWCSGDLSGIAAIYSEDFVAHMPKGWERSEFHGHDGVRDAIARIRNAFSNWTETIEDMIVEGDRIATRYVSTGLHTGAFIGVPPTGRLIRIDEMSIYRLDGNLVAEQWCLTDDIALARQLGRM
jgi:predicted ester cyclase